MNATRRAGKNEFRRKAAAMVVAGGMLIASVFGIASLANGGGTSAATANAAPAVISQQQSAEKVSAGGRASATVPKPLENVGHYGENVYDQAKLGDWRKANAELASLKQAAAGIPGDKAILAADITALDKAIAASDRQAALLASNKVTLDAANMSAAYKTPVPVEVTKLDYYGRQLEIQAAAGNKAGLAQTASEIQSTWNQVRPQVVANGGAQEAKQFDATVAQVMGADTSSQYGKVSSPVLAQVDFLEKVFG